MALGGGTFISQNKILPGSYINFVSAKNASASLSDRGVAAMALPLDWGVQGEVFTVTSEDFQKNSLKIFGYPYTHKNLKGLRDLFRNIKILYAYRLSALGSKAQNEFATALYNGARGNALKLVIGLNSASTDEDKLYDVKLLFDGVQVYFKTVSEMSELEDNDFVLWNKTADIEVTAGSSLSGGADGSIGDTDYQLFLDKIEPYSFNALGCVCEDEGINQLYAAFTKRMRDEVGVKFQTVCFNTAADYEGVINVVSEAVISDDLPLFDKAAAVYWVTGIAAGCEVNRSNLNKLYDGEFVIKSDYTQGQLESAIKAGQFVLHNVNGEKRVLADINSLITTDVDKGEDFKENQTVRIIDQIANDIAVLFNTKYLGVIPNNDSGRVSLWSDIVSHHQVLQSLGAISDFTSDDITVEQGDTKKSVVVIDHITPVNAMAQLYMTCIIE